MGEMGVLMTGMGERANSLGEESEDMELGMNTSSETAERSGRGDTWVGRETSDSAGS